MPTRTWKALPLSGPCPPPVPTVTHGLRFKVTVCLSERPSTKNKATCWNTLSRRAKPMVNAGGKGKAGVSVRAKRFICPRRTCHGGSPCGRPRGKRLWPLYDCGKKRWFAAECRARSAPARHLQKFLQQLMADVRRQPPSGVGVDKTATSTWCGSIDNLRSSIAGMNTKENRKNNFPICRRTRCSLCPL